MKLDRRQRMLRAADRLEKILKEGERILAEVDALPAMSEAERRLAAAKIEVELDVIMSDLKRFPFPRAVAERVQRFDAIRSELTSWI